MRVLYKYILGVRSAVRIDRRRRNIELVRVFGNFRIKISNEENMKKI